MNEKDLGVMSIGIRTPIIREGDDLVKIVVDSVLDATFIKKTYQQFPDPREKSGYVTEAVCEYDINDRDVIGVTESVVARAQGNYVTVDEISDYIRKRNEGEKTIVVVHPIYSRNRFSIILKAISRAAKDVVIYMPDFDEVGNPSGVNPFTGVNMKEYYQKIVEDEGKNCVIHDFIWEKHYATPNSVVIYCGLHDYKEWSDHNMGYNFYTLANICSDKCEYGLLGSNKANEETLKLFPNTGKAQELVERIQARMYAKTNKYVEVMVYGDGCFKDPVGGIWEFADPVVAPAHTIGLDGKPNEIKLKAFADDEFKNLKGKALDSAIKEKIKEKAGSLVGKIMSQGTTPRRFVDLLGSLMDLTSGSGDKGTPVILVKNYFKNYSD